MIGFILRPTFALLCYILLQTNNQVKTYITRTESHRSSVLKTINDYALLTNAFSVQTTADFFACAQSCLGDSQCMSVNFHRFPNNGLCEMSKDYIDGQMEECTRLYYRKGSVFGQLVNVSDPVFPPEIEKPVLKEYVFTTLGASGRVGPTDTIEYKGTLLAGNVKLNDGIQLWTVPQTGNYVIEAFGASGANGTCLGGKVNCTGKKWRLGGLGAVMKGTFNLKKGTKLKILVGQEGSRTVSFGTRPGGGGGGTFVVRNDNTMLIIAGGGGGGAQPKSVSCLDGGPGLVGEDGGVCGGSGGSGGLQCDEMGNPGASLAGGTGAGFNTNGLGFKGFSPGSFSFINGGKGGEGPPSDVQGAFGGGGFGLQNPGGGGGYSGGGMMGKSDTGQAGGGGSYNNGTNPSNKEGANKGHGKVIITYQ